MSKNSVIKRKCGRIKGVFVCACVLIVLGASIALGLWLPNPVDTIITGTNSKTIRRKVNVDGKDVYRGVDTYLIFTKDGTMTNYDCKPFKFDSDDVQEKARQLKGKPVRIWKYGYEFPWKSWRENVLSVDEIVSGK